MAYPKTFVRGNIAKRAHTPADEVNFKFNGFVESAEDTGPTYAELQEQAKARGIRANQSAEALTEALAVDTSEPSNLSGANPPETTNQGYLDDFEVDTESDEA